jgi:hypothetical protein
VRHRKTDYGTIILHWLLVAAFGVAFITGLRIATETPGRSWINLFAAVLPRESVWLAHMQAAVVLASKERKLKSTRFYWVLSQAVTDHVSRAADRMKQRTFEAFVDLGTQP